MLTLKLTLKAIRAQLPKLFYFCLQWFSVCLRVVYTIKSDFYEMSPLAKVKRQDVPDFGEAAFRSHDVSVNVCHYSWDFFVFFFFFLTFFAHAPKPPYWRLCFHAPLSRRETWLAFPPLVGVSVAGYFKGMVIREFLSSVRFWSHTAGICLGVAYPGGRSDDCIKKQIFPSENSGWPDQVFLLSHIPRVAEEYVKISFFWRKISVGMNVSEWQRGLRRHFVCVWQTRWYRVCVFIHVPFVCVWFYDDAGGQFKMRIFKRRENKVARGEEIWVLLSLFTESDFSCLLPRCSIWSLACLLLIINYLPI